MFVAIINTPGYLPDSDSPPPTFETAREAWQYLADERTFAEQDYFAERDIPGEPYSATKNTMEGIAEGILNGADFGIDEMTLEGTIYGPTPGYDGDHDLGVAYEVQIVEDEVHVNYPHEPGRLYDCPACEARCHCDDDPGTTACIFDGEHNFGKTDD